MSCLRPETFIVLGSPNCRKEQQLPDETKAYCHACLAKVYITTTDSTCPCMSEPPRSKSLSPSSESDSALTCLELARCPTLIHVGIAVRQGPTVPSIWTPSMSANCGTKRRPLTRTPLVASATLAGRVSICWDEGSTANHIDTYKSTSLRVGTQGVFPAGVPEHGCRRVSAHQLVPVTGSVVEFYQGVTNVLPSSE